MDYCEISIICKLINDLFLEICAQKEMIRLVNMLGGQYDFVSFGKEGHLSFKLF